MNRYLEKLEFNKILENLSSHCVTYLGKELALNLLPKYNHDQVQMLLNETQEAVNLIYRNSTPIFYEIKNIDVELKNLESNLALSCKSLLDLNLIFKSAYELKQYVNKDYVDMSTYPILNNLFNALYSNKSIIDKITSLYFKMKIQLMIMLF